jgi:hypothetical protein
MSPIAPVYPGAKEVVTSDLEVARSVTYLLSGQASPDVEGFYRRELTQLGYTQLEPGIYRKGTEELMVTVRPAKGNQLSVVVLSRTATVENTRSPHAD